MPQFNITSLNSPSHNANNVRGGLKKTVSVVEAFVHLFVTHEKQAQKIEQDEKLDDSATDDEEASPGGKIQSGRNEEKVNEVGSSAQGVQEGALSPRRSRRRKQMPNGGKKLKYISVAGVTQSRFR